MHHRLEMAVVRADEEASLALASTARLLATVTGQKVRTRVKGPRKEASAARG